MLKRYGWIAFAALVADRVSKAAAMGLTAPAAVIPGVLGLRYAENTGMAFSIFSGSPWLVTLLSAAILVLGGYIITRHRHGALTGTAAMLILGGAAGNLIDRLLRGYVVDMIEILLFPFAVFNVADVCLTVGVGLMILSLCLHPEEWSDVSHGKSAHGE